jgi:hypothetical protein
MITSYAATCPDVEIDISSTGLILTLHVGSSYTKDECTIRLTHTPRDYFCHVSYAQLKPGSMFYGFHNRSLLAGNYEGLSLFICIPWSDQVLHKTLHPAVYSQYHPSLLAVWYQDFHRKQKFVEYYVETIVL